MTTTPEPPPQTLPELAHAICQLRKALTTTHQTMQQQLDAMDRRLRRLDSALSKHTDLFHPPPTTSTRPTTTNTRRTPA